MVLDTNSVLDWLVFRNPAMQPLAQAVTAGQVRWLACASMRRELAHMLGHASLARWQPDGPAALALFDQWACLLAEPLPPAPARLRCSDPDDQIFIDLALAQQARWLVTRDRALLKLARRAQAHGLSVLPPTDWQQEESRPR